jgi:Fe-S oxidoreductase
MARYKMRHSIKKNPEEYIAHKGIYTTTSEIMSRPYITPERNLDWVPKECKISDKGTLLYYVGCLPFFNYEFDELDNIAKSTLRLLCKVENEPVVVLQDEICCGHDIYWGQGKLKTFIKLAKKNAAKFEEIGIRTIVTACAECYRTFKVDYNKIFDHFDEDFVVKHLIEYIYDSWKEERISFTLPRKNWGIKTFTYQDPCRLSRFLPKDNNITDKVREIFKELEKFGYKFTEMAHNKENSLCCGINSWMNCNEKTKALRYKRMLEAKSAGELLLTSCPKCNIHLTCLQNDFENIADIKIIDFSEFLLDHIKLRKGGRK